MKYLLFAFAVAGVVSAWVWVYYHSLALAFITYVVAGLLILFFGLLYEALIEKLRNRQEASNQKGRA